MTHNPIELLVCHKCKQMKEINQFNKDLKVCKECKNQYNHDYKQINKEKVRQYNKQYYIDTPDEHRINGKRWYANHRATKLESQKQRNHLKTKCVNGILNPEIPIGIGTITEYVVSLVLNGCEKKVFNAPYDLLSESLGTINVKASKLCVQNNIYHYWKFFKNENAYVPDYYICLGMDENRHNIIHVWIVPGNCVSIHKNGLRVSNSDRGLSKMCIYEVDAMPYSNEYKNIDIKKLPEFQNLP